MKLGFEESQKPYDSGSQQARAWTERWVKDWVFCPSCGQNELEQCRANSPVADFHCGSCAEQFELKSQKAKFGRKIVDGAYGTMCQRLSASDNPNLFLLQYSPPPIGVSSICVVPKHFFIPEIIEKRKPLAVTARRAGWVGCNILIGEIPETGRIFIVRDGVVQDKDVVLERWQRTIFLRDEKPAARGWLIEVMKCVEDIGRQEFRLEDVYAFERRLSSVYPDNRHVRQKIRQQLQVLRDHGYLEFLGRGEYRLRSLG